MIAELTVRGIKVETSESFILDAKRVAVTFEFIFPNFDGIHEGNEKINLLAFTIDAIGKRGNKMTIMAGHVSEEDTSASDSSSSPEAISTDAPEVGSW